MTVSQMRELTGAKVWSKATACRSEPEFRPSVPDSRPRLAGVKAGPCCKLSDQTTGKDTVDGDWETGHEPKSPGVASGTGQDGTGQTYNCI